MKQYAPIKEGKVREIYDADDALIMVATDRISAFDIILKNQVVNKGIVLTQMSRFWFDFTQNIVKNHMITTDIQQMPEFFRNEKFAGRSMMCKKLEMLPIECIVRGYITGSGWVSYQKDQTVCNIKLPDGLRECDQLPEPIYTKKAYPQRGEEYAQKLRDYTIALYKKCAEYARTKGIIIADTKFEFGLDEYGEVVLADEMLTPDSSRFWPVEGYAPGKGQPSFDKQFVRDWLKQNPNSDYCLPQEVIDKTIAKYLEAYHLLTGKDLTF